MWLDLRRQPETSLSFRAVNRPLFRQDLERFACEPPLPHIRLYHVHYPWYIDVDAEWAYARAVLASRTRA